MKKILVALLFFCGLLETQAWADDVLGGSAESSFNQKYQSRKAERFDIISYLSNQKKIISAQNAKYGSGGQRGFHINPDLVLTYMYEASALSRDSGTIGKAETSLARLQFLANDFISEGGPRRLINIDLGVEAYYLQTQHFVVDSSSNQLDFKTAESGAALLLRPFGRSSQDTGLMFKVGYLNLNETGIWSAPSLTSYSLSTFYYGAEAKLYLLPFLGASAEYDLTASQSDSGLAGRWSMTRARYGGFIEFHLLSVGAFMTTTGYKLSPNSGSELNDTDKGISFVASMFF